MVKKMKSDSKFDPPEGHDEILGDMKWIKMEEGDVLEGEVVEILRRDSKFKKKQLVLTVDTPDGMRCVGCPAKLDQLLTRGRVKLGDNVYIKHVGHIEIGKGQPMQAFRVSVRRGEGHGELPF